MRQSVAVLDAAVVAAGCLVQGLELTSPADGATVTSPVRLSWIEPDGTDAEEPWRFEVSVWRPDGTLAWFASTDGTYAWAPLSPGAYTWTLEAILNDQTTASAGPRSFAVVP